ncbi:MAG TPA: hypothetical protein VGQ36_17860 [Thermoanaerobaculia bacterium]|jgi:hypothetical protein|nr:hypothetical protein [Thermoanaerobaculia bacterium]
MKLKEIRWGMALCGFLAAEVVLIAAAFAWVAIYSYLLHPGESPAFYQQYALRSSPWVSLVMGFPVFYLVCRWIGSRSPSRAWPTAMGVFGIYLLVDLPLTLLGGDNPIVTPLYLAVNVLLKFLGCHFGGRRDAEIEVASPA